MRAPLNVRLPGRLQCLMVLVIASVVVWWVHTSKLANMGEPGSSAAKLGLSPRPPPNALTPLHDSRRTDPAPPPQSHQEPGPHVSLVVPQAGAPLQSPSLASEVPPSSQSQLPSQPPPPQLAQQTSTTAAAGSQMQAIDPDADFDIVYTWVNASSQDHYEQQTKLHVARSRTRDNGELFHSLRSLDQYMRWWKGTLYLITNEVPCWLNVKHPRVQVVNHKQIFLFPYEGVPSYSSQAIESHIHRIPGLRSKFVLMNDDFFVAAHVTPHDFFRKGRAVLRFEQALVDTGYQFDQPTKRPAGLVWAPVTPWTSIMMHSRALVEKFYGLHGDAGSMSPFLFRNLKHAPVSMHKHILSSMWSKWPEELVLSSNTRARSATATLQPTFMHHNVCLLEHGPCDPLDQRLSDLDATSIQTDERSPHTAKPVLDAIKSGKFRFFNLNDAQESSKAVQGNVYIYRTFLPQLYPTPSQWETNRCRPW